MAKNEKPSSKDFDAQREAEAKEAKKKLKEAEKAGGGAKGGKTAAAAKAEKDPKKKKKAKRFVKDFRGELKKIVWPDLKSVVKNTGIVLLVTLIIGSMVWILDYVLSGSVRGLKTIAQGVRTEQTDPSFELEYPELDLPEGVVIEPVLEDEEAETVTQAEAADEEEHDHDDPNHTH